MDELNRISEITEGENRWASFVYNGGGFRYHQMIYGNGDVTAYSYDGLGRRRKKM